MTQTPKHHHNSTVSLLPSAPITQPDDPTPSDLSELQHANPRKALQRAIRWIREVRNNKRDEVQNGPQPHDPDQREGWGFYHAGLAAYHLGRYTWARTFTQKAQEHFESPLQPQGMGNILNLLGALAEQQGERVKAYSHFHAALQLAREHHLAHVEGLSMNNLALTAQSLGDMENALKWTLENLEGQVHLNDNETNARILINSVPLVQRMGMLKEAGEYAQRGYELACKIDKPLLQSHALLVKSELQYHMGNYHQGLLTATQSLDIEREFDNEHGIAKAQVQIGRCMVKLEEYKQAESLLEEALSHLGRNANPNLKVTAHSQLSFIKQRLGLWANARNLLEEAQTIAQNYTCTLELIEVLKMRSELEEEMGNYRAALHAYRAYHTMEKKLHGEQQNQLAQTLLISHEIREQRRIAEELRATNKELIFAANHDPMTGALNRKAFVQATYDFLNQVRLNFEMEDHLTLVMFDIDHFKKVNDTHGHPVGDEVIRRIVKLARQHVRDHDLVCRWGGEEFMLMLPHLTNKDARRVCERLRLAVEQHHWGELSRKLTVTASFGMASWPTSYAANVSIDLIFKEVDNYLYEAKRSGRNRVCSPTSE